jgi:hypothetical protein
MNFPLTPCELCGTPTTHRCGKCEQSAFCSREHQKLVRPLRSLSPLLHLFTLSLSQSWSFHKLQCGEKHFVFAPLEQAQVDLLQAVAAVEKSGDYHWPSTMCEDESGILLCDNSAEVCLSTSFPKLSCRED